MHWPTDKRIRFKALKNNNSNNNNILLILLGCINICENILGGTCTISLGQPRCCLQFQIISAIDLSA
jgi:hypothetical protein